MIKGHCTSPKQGRGSLTQREALLPLEDTEFIPSDMRNGLFSGDHMELFQSPLETAEGLFLLINTHVPFFFVKVNVTTQT